MKKRVKYTKDMPRLLYTYFSTYSESSGAPSFSKFARSRGITLADLKNFRRHREFDRAYCECNEIRKDYLIDTALTKRFDPSLVKFLLSSEFGMGEKEVSKDDGNIKLTLEVVGDNSSES